MQLNAQQYLKSTFHKNFIETVKKIPVSCYDCIVKAVLIIFPIEGPEKPKTPFGWNFFAANIKPDYLLDSDSSDLLVILSH